MEAPVATCTCCGAEDVRQANVRSAFWHDGRLVVVDDIPALQCRRCGEQFYDDATILSLDLMRGHGFTQPARTHVSVPVFSFLDARREEAP